MVIPVNELERLVQLREKITEHFSDDELRTLCFDLGVDYESLGGEGKEGQARQLVAHCARHGHLAELYAKCSQLRPRVDWQEMPAAKSQLSESPGGPLPVGSGNVTVSANRDINAPLVLGSITNSVIKISTSRLPRIVLMCVLAVAVLTLGGVIYLGFEALRFSSPTARPATPDAGKLEPVAPNMAVTALTMGGQADPSTLWIGIQSGTRSALYRLDTRQGAKAAPQYQFEAKERIIGLTVDCRGNVWLLLDNVGTLVYQPRTGVSSTLLNNTTTSGWLSRDTMFAIATRCTANGVQVWLGREGVHTLYYQADYPTLNAITFVPPEKDDVFEASRDLIQVRALRYEAESEKLWMANFGGQLRFVSFRGVLPPQKSEWTDDPLLSLSQSGPVWAGGGNYLAQGDTSQRIHLSQPGGAKPDVQAGTIAVSERWIWFGGRCAESSGAACQPLWVYDGSGFSSVGPIKRKEVRSIVLDPAGAVWIGTDQDLLVYPAADKQAP